MEHLLKTKKEFKNLKKQEIQAIFTKMNLIRLAFNIVWLMGILNIWQEEQLLTKFKAIKRLILPKSLNMMDIKEGLLLMIYNYFDKKSKGGGVAKNDIKQNFLLAKKLYKPIIRNF